MKRELFFGIICTLAMALASCEKDPQPNPTPDSTKTIIGYALNEGNWGGNNASITLITTEGAEKNWFANNNDRGLGELAQDIIHYGSRLYVTVSGSGKVEVLDAQSGKSIKQIDFGTKYPRYMVAHEGKIYVTSYDKTVVRIDTAALEIEATCRLSGLQPEQLCVVGNNLYVCNCWENGTDGNARYDSTISVVNLSTFIETDKIQVSANPGKIKTIDNHRFIVSCAGDYNDPSRPAATYVVDVNDNSKHALDIAASNFDVCGSKVFMYATEYDAHWNTTTSFYTMDISTLATTPILTGYSAELSSAYSINVNPYTQEIFIANSVYGANSDLYIFSANGEKKRQEETGIFTNKVAF